MKQVGQNISKRRLSSGLENNMKAKSLILLTLAPLFLCSCDTYYSKYKAILLLTSNHGNSANISFHEFEGTYVFKLKKKNAGEGDIKYKASLESGKIGVKYYTFGNESNLFSIEGGESLDNHFGYIEQGYKVTIIIISEGKAINGSFSFDLN